jgi:predicted pyridoxine 5'-phosphate oxidase superfamily flavin-nucleotide-binding protein
MSSSDVAFSAAVKRVQAALGSRAAAARGGFATVVSAELRAFLAEIDTAFLATASAEGQPYVQHRGGPRGFIHALDGTTLGFAELRGNRQYITAGNLSENDRVCLLLIDYAERRRVKVWGRARRVDPTPELLAQLGPVAGRVEAVVFITVTAWDANCPHHIPVKLDATEVAEAVRRLEARVAALLAENHRLRAAAGGTAP